MSLRRRMRPRHYCYLALVLIWFQAGVFIWKKEGNLKQESGTSVGSEGDKNDSKHENEESTNESLHRTGGPLRYACMHQTTLVVWFYFVTACLENKGLKVESSKFATLLSFYISYP